MPTAMHKTIAPTPRMEEMTIGVWRRYTAKPKTIAMRINMMETMATDAFVALAAMSRTPSL